jgi:cytochrome c biogenesis protein CcdA
MTMLLLAFLGGVLTILSPCILPVVPLVFARTGRGFARETGPMLLGLAAAFTAAAMIARATAHWLLVANEIGRDIALAMLAIVGLSLLSVRMAEWLTRPITRAGASLLGTGSATSGCSGHHAPARSSGCSSLLPRLPTRRTPPHSFSPLPSVPPCHSLSQTPLGQGCWRASSALARPTSWCVASWGLRR